MNNDKNNSAAVSQPHDKLVKRLLSNPAAARDILTLYLPKDILAMVDLNVLELQRDSFIDDEHRAFAVDLLFKTTFNSKEGYFWILIEHQRKDDAWMPVRIFKYIAIIWDHLRKSARSTSKASIPLVYPIVIYNGDKPYSHSLTLSDLIEPDGSKKLFSDIYTKSILLIDLASIQDDELKENVQDHVRGISLLMALKHTFDRHLQTFFEQILIETLIDLDRLGDVDEVIDIIYYLVNENSFLDTERFWTTIYGKFSEKTEDKMTTIAQQLRKRGFDEGIKKGIEEGIKKGIEKGVEEGIEKVARKLLNNKHDLNEHDLIKWVKEMTSLSEEKIRELREKC